MLAREEWKRRQNIIRDSTHVRSVKVKVHDRDTSYLEGILCRGDRRLGRVIEQAWRNGARFDGWSEGLKMDAWLSAFQQLNIDPDWYALRERSPDEILPWAIVSDTVGSEFLKREYERSRKGIVTPSCADPAKDPCALCDACARSPRYAAREEEFGRAI
jgi:hypothetical protein